MRVLHSDLRVLELRTRMPFKYGIATLTEVPHLFLRIKVRIDGREQVGLAAESLVPKWFTKDPAQPIADEIRTMIDVVRTAAHCAVDRSDTETPFDWWQDVYAEQAAWGADKGHPPLLWAFGVTLVERAMLDAFCRAHTISFAAAVRRNALGIRLGDIHDALQGLAPADLLPSRPRRRLIVRHTVGLGDPITDGDIPPADRLHDGLPQSLESCILRDGLTHFKIKIGGDPVADVERLQAIAQVIAAHCDSFKITLDGNEALPDVTAFRAHWEAIGRCRELAQFLEHLLFVEQPIHRAAALAPATTAALLAWPQRPPMIIDESDGELHSSRTALAGGYVGTSHKNCKGVFKGIANACLIAHRRRQVSEARCLISAEDLANVGPVALLQDLAVVATLGIDHAERNGHHYFHGLSMWPAPVRQQALDAHPDLYQLDETGIPVLQIRDGTLSMGSVVDAPFGTGIEMDMSQFTPLEE